MTLSMTLRVGLAFTESISSFGLVFKIQWLGRKSLCNHLTFWFYLHVLQLCRTRAIAGVDHLGYQQVYTSEVGTAFGPRCLYRGHPELLSSQSWRASINPIGPAVPTPGSGGGRSLLCPVKKRGPGLILEPEQTRPLGSAQGPLTAAVPRAHLTTRECWSLLTPESQMVISLSFVVIYF